MSGYEANTFDDIESEQLLKYQSNNTSSRKTEYVSNDSIQNNENQFVYPNSAHKSMYMW